MPSLERQIKELRAYIEEAKQSGEYPHKLRRKLDAWRDQFKPSYFGQRHTLLDDTTLDAWIARQKGQWLPQARAALENLEACYMRKLGQGEVVQATATLSI